MRTTQQPNITSRPITKPKHTLKTITTILRWLLTTPAAQRAAQTAIEETPTTIPSNDADLVLVPPPDSGLQCQDDPMQVSSPACLNAADDTVHPSLLHGKNSLPAFPKATQLSPLSSYMPEHSGQQSPTLMVAPGSLSIHTRDVAPTSAHSTPPPPIAPRQTQLIFPTPTPSRLVRTHRMSPQQFNRCALSPRRLASNMQAPTTTKEEHTSLQNTPNTSQ